MFSNVYTVSSDSQLPLINVTVDPLDKYSLLLQWDDLFVTGNTTYTVVLTVGQDQKTMNTSEPSVLLELEGSECQPFNVSISLPGNCRPATFTGTFLVGESQVQLCSFRSKNNNLFTFTIRSTLPKTWGFLCRGLGEQDSHTDMGATRRHIRWTKLYLHHHGTSVWPATFRGACVDPGTLRLTKGRVQYDPGGGLFGGDVHIDPARRLQGTATHHCHTNMWDSLVLYYVYRVCLRTVPGSFLSELKAEILFSDTGELGLVKLNFQVY